MEVVNFFKLMEVKKKKIKITSPVAFTNEQTKTVFGFWKPNLLVGVLAFYIF
jgi:hypothetical protein